MADYDVTTPAAKAPDDLVRNAVQEAIVEAWCALDDVKETAKRLQSDLHLLSHYLYLHNDLPLDAACQLAAVVNGKLKELLRTVEGCVGQVVDGACENAGTA